MATKNIIIRDLHMSDIPKAMELVIEEGWNQTEKDWKLFLENPLNICKCAEINHKLVGTTTSYNFSNKMAWISMVLVNKDFRGMGISKQLVKSVLKRLERCPSIKLDATLAGRNIYKKFGFKDEVRISRLVGQSTGLPDTSSFDHVFKIEKSDVSNVIELDHQFFGADRSFLFKYWINEYTNNSWMIKVDNKLAGFALARQGNRFFQIGPVSALNTALAKELIFHSFQIQKGKQVIIDIMDDKPELLDWLISLGFEKKREFIRMYKDNNPISGSTNNQFVIAGPEFG